MSSVAADAAGPSDAEVVQKARNGDHDAFRMLVERYQGRAFRLAQRRRFQKGQQRGPQPLRARVILQQLGHQHTSCQQIGQTDVIHVQHTPPNQPGQR